MRIRLEMDDHITEDEVVIRCRELNEEILALQKQLFELTKQKLQLHVTKEECSYFLNLDEILFLETNGSVVVVHTAKNLYETRQRLYELEDLLPASFVRISKSAIINTEKIRSIKRNLTGASEVEFLESTKRTFISRSYFKALMEKMEEKRLKK